MNFFFIQLIQLDIKLTNHTFSDLLPNFWSFILDCRVASSYKHHLPQSVTKTNKKTQKRIVYWHHVVNIHSNYWKHWKGLCCLVIYFQYLVLFMSSHVLFDNLKIEVKVKSSVEKKNGLSIFTVVISYFVLFSPNIWNYTVKVIFGLNPFTVAKQFDQLYGLLFYLWIKENHSIQISKKYNYDRYLLVINEIQLSSFPHTNNIIIDIYKLACDKR